MADFTAEQEELIEVVKRVATLDDEFARRDAHQRLLVILAAQRSNNLDQVNWSSLRSWVAGWNRELEYLGL